MSLSDLASIGSLVSGVAVLASLIYLNLQTRQSAANQRAALHQGRAFFGAEYFMKMTEATLEAPLFRGGAGDPNISPADFAKFASHFAAMMLANEDYFYQHRSGMMDDDRFVSTLAGLRLGFQQPGACALWTVYGSKMFDKSFVNFIDGIIAEARASEPRDFFADWKAELASETKVTRAAAVD